jgi:hypothetical protein
VATVPGGQRDDEAANGAVEGLTPAELHALSRSAPLTPAQFKAQREVAERRNVPLHMLLDERHPVARPRDVHG